jgi:biotin carboxyl carrier protein
MKKFISASVNKEKNIELGKHLRSIDLERINDQEYHAIWNNKSLRIKVLSWNRDDSTISLEVNNEYYLVSLHNELDQLIQKMGFNTKSSNAHENIHAPMPGRVLRIDVHPGDQVKTGEPMLILEAMKMENVIKATADGTIKTVHTTAGSTVDKGDLIIEYEHTSIL